MDAHAFTYLDYVEAAKKYGKVGGFAHLKTLVDQVRAQRSGSLLLDGGDTWQGSWTALKTNAQDMVDAQLALGVDVMTAHWEMTFGADEVRAAHTVGVDFHLAPEPARILVRLEHVFDLGVGHIERGPPHDNPQADLCPNEQHDQNGANDRSIFSEG